MTLAAVSRRKELPHPYTLWDLATGGLEYPWFVDEAALLRFPFIPEFFSRGGLEVYCGIKDGRSRQKDLLYATFAASDHHKAPTALRWIERGLLKYPRSAVLHLEHGRWLATCSAMGRWTKAAAVEAWKRGLAMGGVPPAVVRRVAREADYLAGLSARAPYPPPFPELGKLGRSLRARLYGENPLDAYDRTSEQVGRMLAGHFRVHEADRCAAYALVRHVLPMIVLPERYASSAPSEVLVDRLKNFAPERVSCSAWKVVKREGDHLRLRVDGREHGVDLSSPLETARSFDRILGSLRAAYRIYRAGPIPEKGMTAIVLLKEGARRFVLKNKLLSLRALRG